MIVLSFGTTHPLLNYTTDGWLTGSQMINGSYICQIKVNISLVTKRNFYGITLLKGSRNVADVLANGVVSFLEKQLFLSCSLFVSNHGKSQKQEMSYLLFEVILVILYNNNIVRLFPKKIV